MGGPPNIDPQSQLGSANQMAGSGSDVKGAIEYDTLYDLWNQSYTPGSGIAQGSALGNYLGDEFKFKQDHLQYITPLDFTGLQTLSEKLGIDMETIRNVYADTVRGASLSAGESLAEMQSNMKNRVAATGMAVAGSEAFKADTSRAIVERAYGADLGAARLGKEADTASKNIAYSASKFDEEQRLLNQFFADVGKVKQLQAQESSGGGKK